MENLNAEQVKKALEWCYEEASCSECLYQKICFESSEWQILKDALALINSQEQRIKELTEENERLRENSKQIVTDAVRSVSRLTEENERLRVDNEILKMPRATIFEIADAFDRGRKKGEADTVRKMQERLKEKIYSVPTVYNAHFGRMIDQIAKEMLEGDK